VLGLLRPARFYSDSESHYRAGLADCKRNIAHCSSSVANEAFAEDGKRGWQGNGVNWRLIASSERHGIDVQLYLRSVLAHLPAATPDEIERYLPDRWKSDLMAEQQAATDAKQDQWRRVAAGVTASA
jgi:hypothetical protein